MDGVYWYFVLFVESRFGVKRSGVYCDENGWGRWARDDDLVVRR